MLAGGDEVGELTNRGVAAGLGLGAGDILKIHLQLRSANEKAEQRERKQGRRRKEFAPDDTVLLCKLQAMIRYSTVHCSAVPVIRKGLHYLKEQLVRCSTEQCVNISLLCTQVLILYCTVPEGRGGTDT